MCHRDSILCESLLCQHGRLGHGPDGAWDSPEEGDGIPQVGRSPHLWQDPTAQAGYPCPVPQQGKAECAADETRKGLAVSQCHPERVVNRQHRGLPRTSGLHDLLGQAHPAGVTFLVAFPTAVPHGNLGFQGFLYCVWGNWSSSMHEQSMSGIQGGNRQAAGSYGDGP